MGGVVANESAKMEPRSLLVRCRSAKLFYDPAFGQRSSGVMEAKALAPFRN